MSTCTNCSDYFSPPNDGWGGICSKCEAIICEPCLDNGRVNIIQDGMTITVYECPGCGERTNP